MLGLFKILFLTIVASCATNSSHEEKIDYSSDILTTETFGLEFDEISVSSVSKGKIKERKDSLKVYKQSSLLLNEYLLVDLFDESSSKVSSNLIKKTAEETLEENIKNSLSDETLYLSLLHFIKIKDYAKSYFFLTKLFQSSSKAYQAKAYNVQGVIKLSKGDTLAAASNFRASYKLDKENEASRLNLALLYLKYGFFEETQKYLDGFSDHPIARFMTLLLDQEVNQQYLSLSDCESFISNYPKNKFFLFNCGKTAYHIFKKYDLAKKWLVASMSNRPSFKEIDLKSQKMIKVMSDLGRGDR